MITRRRWVAGATGVGLGTAIGPWAFAADGWKQGDVVHILPAANHERLAIKCSFRAPRRPPLLRVGSDTFRPRQTDSEGRYWSFDVAGLRPATTHRLQLLDNGRRPLTDSWPLRTVPAPDARPDSVRILAYTCAGGFPEYPGRGAARQPFLPLATRQRLLGRALALQPDAAIAIGDHFYWDQRTQLDSARPEVAARTAAFYDSVGALDRRLPAKGTRNEAAIKRALEPQIAHLYGVMLRSTPSYFINDDHDYFENDEATDRFVTLPLHAYQRSFARFARDLFLPEFLPDVARPALLSGAGAGDRPPGISESFGTMRYGDLAEVLMYDCARFLSLKGKTAGLVPPEVEAWLAARTADQRVRHLLHVPSHPFGWSAGKWREWYPDVADTGAGDTAIASIGGDGSQRFKLTTDKQKFMWQPGWFAQHQRLLTSLSSQSARAGIVLSGDLHATGHTRLLGSGSLDLRRNPVDAILTGPIGTKNVWPSMARGTPPMKAVGLVAEDQAEVTEQNGFAMIDLRRREAVISLYAWRHEEEEAIDGLLPYHRYRVARRG